ncbi:alpha-amylase-like protein Aah4 [Schizosaccharomyces osmophilus]|uniref:Alpha-amylase-like protein Aah4 n=1 Tax=Schizosaccharomyces osmophilus TaxID=2545709 RepID=A0AAE9WDH0_9SCHI|nr:alpha-amylase-like protein Aah4 [Schizosaccharomyces osmophilus]WBW73296.1 alpha-amylase-like protein Aah4 [Schizosaccharomyces osmophilus]
MKLSLKNLGLSIGLVSGVVSPVLALGAEDWKKQSIYSVLTDRFATKDVVPRCNIRLQEYCGGDWSGIQDHLDYIQELGFTALLLSPVAEVVENTEKSNLCKGYQGYSYRLNTRFGTEKELRELSDALHMRGMNLMVDVVINHLDLHEVGEIIDEEYDSSDEEDNDDENCVVLDDEDSTDEDDSIPCEECSFPDHNDEDSTDEDDSIPCEECSLPDHNDEDSTDEDDSIPCEECSLPDHNDEDSTDEDDSIPCEECSFPDHNDEDSTDEDDSIPCEECSLPDHNDEDSTDEDDSIPCEECSLPDHNDEDSTDEDDSIPCEECSLPDHNKNLIFIKEALKEYIHSFVKDFKVDGIRIGSANHFPKEYLPEFCEAAGVYCMAESLSQDAIEICDGQNSIEGLMNHPVEDAARVAFLSSNLDGMINLADAMTDIRGLCRDPLSLANFVETPYLSRMASITSDPAALKNAIAFLLMGDGIPIMYYGQELALRGTTDPYTRPVFWEKGFPKKNPYYYFTSVVNNFRNAMFKSDSGETFLTSQSDISIVDGRVMLLQRGEVITVLNNLGSFYIRFHYTVSALEHKWIDIITCKTVPVEDNRQVFIIRNGDPMILYPEYKSYELGICPSPSIPTEDRFFATPVSDPSSSFSSTLPDPEGPQASKATEPKQSANSIIIALFVSLIMIL